MLGKIYLEGLLQPLRSQSPGVGLSKALFSTFPFSSSDVYGSYNDAAVELCALTASPLAASPGVLWGAPVLNHHGERIRLQHADPPN